MCDNESFIVDFNMFVHIFFSNPVNNAVIFINKLVSVV
jgi:hypothetical protein